MILFNPNKMIDIIRTNDAFKATSTSKVGEFLSDDIFKILIKEKSGLKDYDTISIDRVVERYYKYNEEGILSEPELYYEIHISCSYDKFQVGGSEHIFDLPQKIRETKINLLLN